MCFYSILFSLLLAGFRIVIIDLIILWTMIVFFDIVLQNFKTVHCRKIFVGVCFYHFWRFLRVMKLVFVIVISVTSVVFSSITGWFWLPRFVFMIIKNNCDESIFGFNITFQKVDLIIYGFYYYFAIITICWFPNEIFWFFLDDVNLICNETFKLSFPHVNVLR